MALLIIDITQNAHIVKIELAVQLYPFDITALAT